jgi:hypothetical protein
VGLQASVISAGPAFERASERRGKRLVGTRASEQACDARRACERASFCTPMNDSLMNILVVEINKVVLVWASTVSLPKF